MTHNPGGNSTPPRVSFTSSYSYGYSPTSEEPQHHIGAPRQGTVAPLSRHDNGPTSPPLQVLTEEYALAFRVPARKSDDEQQSAFDFQNADPMDKHLLLETAMNDCQNFRILSLGDLDALKKEEARLDRLIEAGKKKLYLESKVDSTSRLLQKLSTNGSNATSPTSPVSSKRSFLRFRTSGSSNVDSHTFQGETGSGSARFQELAKEVWRLEKRQIELRRRKLEHTAAILESSNQRQAPVVEEFEQHRTSASYSYDNQSGYKDQILQSAQGYDGTLEGYEWQSTLRARLPKINNELHGLLIRVQSQSSTPRPPPPGKEVEPVTQFDYLENSLQKLNESHSHLRRLVHESRTSREGQQQQLKDHEVLTRLWDMIRAVETVSHGKNVVNTAKGESSNRLLASEAGQGASFSLQALSSKVQNLCNQTTLLSKQQIALNQQLTQEREARRTSNAEKTTEQVRLTEQLQEAYNQHLAGQNALRDIQSRLKATELRLKETQHLVTRTKQDCEVKFNEELTQERTSWKAREHDLSARLASKVTEAGLLRTAISEGEAKIADMQAAEAATLAEFNEADHQIETLGANLMAAENRLAKFENAEMDKTRVIDQLEAEKERQEAELALLREEVAKITADLMAAEGHLTHYESTAEESAQKISELAAGKREADDEVVRLNMQIAPLIERLPKSGSSAFHGNTETHDTRRRLSELNSVKEGLEMELNRLRAELDSLRAALMTMENRAATLQTSSQEWSDYASELETHKQTLEGDIKQFQKQLDTVRTKMVAATAAKDAELESLTTKYMDLLQEFKELSNAQAQSVNDLQLKKQQFEELERKHMQMSNNEVRVLRSNAEDDVHEGQSLVVQLETSAARQRETEGRIRTLENELRDLVQDYEHLVRIEIEAEREREILEQTLEALRDRVEELQFQLDEERVQSMGKRSSSSTNDDRVNRVNGDGHGGDVRRSTEGISMGVMRNEFKRMMREARADHYRRLKAEQEEHRRLEEVIRSMQRERVRGRSSIPVSTSQGDISPL